MTYSYKCGIKWNQERLSRLVIIWQNSRTIDQVCDRMGCMYSEVMGQVQRLRTMGVPLKRFNVRAIDFDKLKALAEKHQSKCGCNCGCGSGKL